MTSGHDTRATVEKVLADAIRIAGEAFLKHKLHPDIAARYGVAAAVTKFMGRQVPVITSGYRSLAYQKALYERWKRGEKGIYKPAPYSRHTTTVAGIPAATAVDVDTTASGFQIFRPVWLALKAGRWGGNYNTPDPPHFTADWPTYPKPVKAF